MPFNPHRDAPCSKSSSARRSVIRPSRTISEKRQAAQNVIRLRSPCRAFANKDKMPGMARSLASSAKRLVRHEGIGPGAGAGRSSGSARSTSHLVAVRDQVDHLIGGGLVDQEKLRVIVAPAARRAAVAKLHAEGLSGRQIAAAVGVDEITVRRDLAAANAAEGAADAAPKDKRAARRDSIRQKNEAIAAVEPEQTVEPR
jgi:Homeodomain-like domain